MTGEHEEVLAGGNMTAVVRVGNTVRRGAGPWTTTIFRRIYLEAGGPHAFVELIDLINIVRD
jgi:hypothetical protein